MLKEGFGFGNFNAIAEADIDVEIVDDDDESNHYSYSTSCSSQPNSIIISSGWESKLRKWMDAIYADYSVIIKAVIFFLLIDITIYCTRICHFQWKKIKTAHIWPIYTSNFFYQDMLLALVSYGSIAAVEIVCEFIIAKTTDMSFGRGPIKPNIVGRLVDGCDTASSPSSKRSVDVSIQSSKSSSYGHLFSCIGAYVSYKSIFPIVNNICSYIMVIWPYVVIMSALLFQFLDYLSRVLGPRDNLSYFWLEFFIDNINDTSGGTSSEDLIQFSIAISGWLISSIGIGTVLYKLNGLLRTSKRSKIKTRSSIKCNSISNENFISFERDKCNISPDNTLDLPLDLRRKQLRHLLYQKIAVMLLCFWAFAASRDLVSDKYSSDCNSLVLYPNAFYMVGCGYKNQEILKKELTLEELGISQREFESTFIGSSELYTKSSYDGSVVDFSSRYPSLDTNSGTSTISTGIIKRLSNTTTTNTDTTTNTNSYAPCESNSRDTSALFRRTLGFTGAKELDIALTYPANKPPNILVIVLESFRASIVGALNPASKKKGFISPTPHFDELCKHGLLFSNAWTNGFWTTRALEAILYGQMSLQKQVITAGCTECKFKGLPDLMRAKGYEVIFSGAGDGLKMEYDNWYNFFKAHGYTEDQLWGVQYHENIAKEFGIDLTDIKPKKGFKWGLHDDITLETLGLKIKQMHENRQSGKTNKPFFINHFTISTHYPFNNRPPKFDAELSPDFSMQSESIRHKYYQQMLYFTDKYIGKLIALLKSTGVLKETVVLLVGDHGPPMEGLLIGKGEEYTHIPMLLLAENQLGKYKGTLSNITVSQVDIMNTIADLLGVPEGGFLQHGIGRSALRKEKAEKVAYSRFSDTCMAEFQRFKFFCDCSKYTEPCLVYDIIEDPNQAKGSIRDSGVISTEILNKIEKNTRLIATYTAAKSIFNLDAN